MGSILSFMRKSALLRRETLTTSMSQELHEFHLVHHKFRSLSQRRPAKCDVSECDREESIMRKP